MRTKLIGLVLKKEQATEGPSCHYCQIRSFSTSSSARVAIKNTVDASSLPPAFRFIEHCILTPGVERADAAFRSGCSCESPLDCHRAGCRCLEDVEGDAEGDGEVRYAYNVDGCLREELLESRSPVYECHEGCGCGAECDNRVVERGRTIPLDVFKTGDGRGWGLFPSFLFPISIAGGGFGWRTDLAVGF